MWKKILAGAGTVALALGLVTLAVAPAEAHTGDLNVTASCNTQTGNYDLTATLTISQTGEVGSTKWRVGTSNFEGTPTSNANMDRGPVASNGAQTITLGTFSLPGSTTGLGPWVYAFTTWTPDNYKAGSDGQLYKNQALDGTCGNDNGKKITICHYNGGRWVYTSDDVSKSSIINLDPNGHGTHVNDIIPSFDYVDNGVTKSYPGKNWTAGGQLIHDNGCKLPNAPPAPTYTEAVCTAGGQVGTASVTIPAGVPGIQYYINGVQAAQGSTVPFAAGTKVTVTVQVISGYELAYPSLPTFPSHTFTNVSTSCVQAIAPTVTQAVCDGPGTHSTASYTIVAVDHVTYKVNGQPVSGTVNVTDFTSPVVVTATATQGHTLVGPASFTLNFTDPGACLTPVTAPVTFTESQCTTPGASSDASYTIPTGDGVTYTVTVDGAPGDGSAGTHVVAKDAHVIVVATAKTGYQLSGQTTFDKTFTDPGSCLQPAPVTTAPQFVDAACVANVPGGETDASYTLTAADHVSYEVSTDGVHFVPQTTGTHTVAQGTQLEIHAIPESGYIVTGTSSWSHSFTSLGDSCLSSVTPATPNFTPAVCYGDRPGHSSASYEIDAVDHVHYLVSLNGGKTWKKAKTGVDVKVGAGATVWIKPVADDGYKLTDATVTKHTFTDPGLCLVTVTPIVPTFTDAVCSETPGQQSSGSYTIPKVDHVFYNVVINGHTHLAVKPGTYNTQPGDKVYVVALPKLGYMFGDGDWFWNHTFADPGQCLVTVTIPVDPTISDQVCTVNPDSKAGILTNGVIHVTPVTGVKYTIDGADVTSDDTSVAPGTHTVAAVALTGYTLSGNTGPWTLTSKAADLCGDLVTHPGVVPLVTSTQPTCTAGGSYTLSNDIDVPQAVVWTVDGAPAQAGTFTVAGAATVHIHAAPKAPDYGFDDPDQQTDWTLTFSAPANCDLKTLALTGTTLPIGWIGGGVLLLVAGLSLMVVQLLRRRRGEV